MLRSDTGESAERLRALGAVLGQAGDIIAERVASPAPPTWCERRGWSAFLLGLDDAALEGCEHGETARVLSELAGVPASLRAFAREVLAATELSPLEPHPPGAPALLRASERKRRQVGALATLVSRWAPGARRVVDLGAGHGHLTRELASCLGVEALGVEAREHVVEGARALTASDAVRFVRRDAIADPIELAPGDLVVGLHACGALGDAIARAAAESGAGVLLVSCCPQKIDRDERAPLSSIGRALGLRMAREHLGLANLATLAEGGKDSAGVMERRLARRALFLLLQGEGVSLAPGDEMRGVPRRQTRRGLDPLIAFAFARRGLRPPSDDAVSAARARAAEEHPAMRRLSLPRAMLARVLELTLVHDRAALLDEARSGAPARVVEAFERSASPRNVAILRAPALTRRP